MTSHILFGAGASYGSENDTTITPPLGDNLFDKLVSRNGIATDFPQEIKKVFYKQGFEYGMNAVIETYKKGNYKTVIAFQRELAEYLLQFTPTNGNLYRKVLRKTKHHNFTYSTLNYDMLFELSAFQLGLNVCYGGKKNKNVINLLKPHGSVNFWPDLNGLSIGVIDGDQPISSVVECDGKILTRSESLSACKTETALSPSMAYYVKGKRVDFAPNVVGRQQAEWVQEIGRSRNIFIIGVRVNFEVDTHIWGNLAKCEGNIHYFGNNSDEIEFKSWGGSISKENLHFHHGYFNEALDTINKMKWQEQFRS
ncbi:hypothetical protein ACYAXZ_18610 [Klebsiella pneumoniae]|jgi:hypothetical protein|uniref:hypothetical protein n=3 Tax=Klebsiella pneumoniae TaxID=573 RepID=UPI0015DF46D5|nr:hypothetical protein [Klebsiella pneumoniae]HCL9258430.1 hypothetical protein [Escherichia coli]MBA0065291.1 hypothetical protein [Klebsiella pneumoniae]MDP0793975.1 hypothetical protein [Klebsiella pneumoniae]MDX4464708.1 hypothetical protein [Klebsiella pneumoniae]HBQ5469859.1 hypothetical protein [Klebsiella pneumoniae]